MSLLWKDGHLYRFYSYSSERELEQTILQVQASLFGSDRIYLDVKRKIGIKGSQRNIPDGYLLDFSGSRPRLFVVENELAEHDPLRHVAVQILQFSLSFEEDARAIRTIVFDSIHSDAGIKDRCEAYVSKYHCRNLDHLIDILVFDSRFSAVVVIDQIPQKLEKILADRFNFGVAVLYLSRYQNQSGEIIYDIKPFWEDITPLEDIDNSDAFVTALDVETDEIDTVIVPAHQEGFENTFLGENAWYAIRIHGTVKPQLKYIAGYQVRPISAITHVAKIKAIEPYGDEGRYKVIFDGPAESIQPIKMVKGGKVRSFQNLRYTNLYRLQNAKNLDEVFYRQRD